MKYLYFFVCGIENLDWFVEKINGDEFMKKIVKEVKKISGEENVIPYVTEHEMIINLYNNGASLDIISKSSGLSIEEVKKIIDSDHKKDEYNLFTPTSK